MNSSKNESEAILKAVKRESSVLGTSDVARTVNETLASNDQNDPIEKLGKIIGRTLGWIGVVVLIILLAMDLIPHFQKYF